ncbi:MAG: bi-domain-containing oxidoreductase, partial [Sphingorhabdus sp.]
VKVDGLMPTIEAVRNKLDQPLAPGYCNVGVVEAVGRSVNGFEVGDRIVSNGKHAEFVTVPVNLCAKIPAGLSDDDAAFTIIGAIALQGIRLANPTLGETVAVFGVGLIGLIAVQLLRANGCRVIAIDFDTDKLKLAESFGALPVNLSSGQDAVQAAMGYTQGRGVDAVIIAASTQSSDPIHQAAQMSRKRGRIVLVGVTGLELSRADFYEKELSFQVSCSYGPGRYDPEYEEKGIDYPLPFVRWTEQRNFEAVLDLMADGSLNMRPLVTHRYPIDEVGSAYNAVTEGTRVLGILLEYEAEPTHDRSRTITLAPDRALTLRRSNRVGVGFIGAGNYAGAALIPAFKAAGAELVSIASASGASGLHAARKFDFAETTTDIQQLFKHDDIDVVVITTQHNSHADFAVKALAANKHVFVEKPLCMTHEELVEIRSVLNRERHDGESQPMIMVGYNRRFAPHVQMVKKRLDSIKGPKSFIMTINAGPIPATHWTQDPVRGGGRILGEACHFVDLMRYLSGHPIKKHSISYLNDATRDTAVITLAFADGSVGAINYFANGTKAFPKERIEIFADGGILQIDNFRKLKAFNWKHQKDHSLWRQDKGQAQCARAIIDAIANNQPSPIPLDEIIEVAQICIDLAKA